MSALNFTTSLRYSKSGDNLTGTFSKATDPASDARIDLNISVGTSDETVALGDIGTIGEIIILNLNATNFITCGPDGSSYPIKIKPGSYASVCWNAAAIHLKADTGACRCRVLGWSA